MSRLNGDKSRHQINRKRTVVRRAKIRAMVAEKKNPSTGGDQTGAASPRAAAKAR